MKNRVTYDDWLAVEQTNPVAKGMRLAQGTCHAVLKGSFPIAFLSGPPGVGKNIAVRKAIDEGSGPDPVKCNPTNYTDLLKQIGVARKKKAPLWLDEADVIFRSDRMLNVIKTATGAKRDRIYNGQNVDVPQGIFVATNSSLRDEDIPSWWDKNLIPHADALWSRSTPVNICREPLDLWEYSVFLAQTTSMIWQDEDGDGVPVKIREEALDWFTRNLYKLKEVSPRTLTRIVGMMNRSQKANPTVEKEVADATLNAMIIYESRKQPPLSPEIARKPPVKKAKR